MRRGFALEWATLGWNVAGVALLAVTAARASSVALAGFALDSLIEIGASTVVIWELKTQRPWSSPTTAPIATLGVMYPGTPSPIESIHSCTK